MNAFHPFSTPLTGAPDPRIEVIGIVASLGGIEAIRKILIGLPADFPASIVVFQHLGRGHHTFVELLRHEIMLQVQWASDGEVLKPATVYVTPPGSVPKVFPDGTLALIAVEDLPPSEQSRKGWPGPDAFLTSLAVSYGSTALALVLSGMGSSGAIGVQRVKRHGGIVLAQDKESSMRWSMPQAAIETGCVDLVLPLQKIAPLLLTVVSSKSGLPQNQQERQAGETLFAGGGATGALLHTIDWSRTPPGRILSWDPALRVTVRNLLSSPQPLALFWGKELLQIYNDAYGLLLCDAHPRLLGQGISDSWQEGADLLLPLIEQVRSTSRAVERADQRFPIYQHGIPLEEYATISVSPIRDELGSIGGFLLSVQRTTDQHVSERRLHTLSELGGVKARVSSVQLAYEAAAHVLANNRIDFPFVLLYRFDETRQQALLSGITGLKAGGPASPEALTLDSQNAIPWPLDWLARTDKTVRIDQLSQRLPGFSFPEQAQTAFLLPLSILPDAPPIGCAVLGVHPRALLDPTYYTFLDRVARQIAQNVQTALQLEEARQRAEALTELHRVKAEFFSNISHEFRTPLTLLLGPLEELLSGTYETLSTSQRAAVELAHRNGVRLLKQVNTLLDFSRLEAGRMRTHLEPVDLAALTADLASGFRPAIERAGLRLIVDCPPLPEPVLVDSEMWEKIVLNLLSNALKFTLAGEIAVRLSLRTYHVELTISDTGIGIDKIHLPHLFERFYRVPGSSGRTSEGSGIGLALVDELVRQHYGAIRVESQPHEGSLFKVWLPRKPSFIQEEAVSAFSTRTGVVPFTEEASQWIQDELDQLSGELLPSVEPLSAPRPDARVLVADDNADMRGYLCRLLSRYWKVETVADGEQALAALDHLMPDLVLADVMMPKIDGFDLLRRLRERPGGATLPIILVTARAGEEAAIEGLLAGADDYITKPFSARELVARVGAQLELARLRRESRAALERSEAFLRTAVEASGVGVWELDVQTGRYALSERVYDLLGIETDCEDVNTAMTVHVHPEDRERLEQAQIQALNPHGDGHYYVEYRVLQQNERMRWLEARGRTSFQECDGGRQPVVLRGAILDVSEQKRLLEVVRQAPDFIGVCSSDLTFDFLNEAGKRILGLEGADVSGVRLLESFPPEEQGIIREVALPEAMREGLWIGEAHLCHHYLLSVVPVDCRMYANYAEDGRFVGLAIIATDISERKRAEAAQIHFRALFESAPGLYLVLEPEEFRIVAVSDAYLRATMTQREAIMGKTLFEVFPDDPVEPWADGERNLRASLERTRGEKRADVMAVQRYPIRRPETEGGAFEERWWSPINSPVQGPEGDVTYIIHRVEDVTPFIRQMQQQGQEADGLYQLESRAQHMEAEIVLRAQELQRVNEQLRKSEERYRSLLHTLSFQRTQEARKPDTTD